MVKLGWKVLGLPALQGKFNQLKDDGTVDRVLEAGALEVERRTKQRIAVDTGRSRAATGHYRAGRLAWAIVVRTNYYPFVELGTGRRGAASSQPGGVPDGYSHGPSPGMAARPALRPSLLEVEEILKRPETWKDLTR